MLKTKVKVGQVTNLSDARYCAGMGVDLLGFPVAAHHGIDPKKYQEITNWVNGPLFVVEWEGEITKDFEAIILPYNADFVEIDAHQLKNIPDSIEHLIVNLELSDWPSVHKVLSSFRHRIDYLILTSEGVNLDTPLIAEIALEFEVLIGFGINEETLDKLTALPVAGISLKGSIETNPGLKDYAHLSTILERLELTGE